MRRLALGAAVVVGIDDRRRVRIGRMEQQGQDAVVLVPGKVRRRRQHIRREVERRDLGRTNTDVVEDDGAYGTPVGIIEGKTTLHIYPVTSRERRQSGRGIGKQQHHLHAVGWHDAAVVYLNVNARGDRRRGMRGDRLGIVA